MKERDTVILSIRIPKDLLPQLNERIARSKKYKSRNAWILRAVYRSLRTHRKQADLPTGVKDTA